MTAKRQRTSTKTKQLSNFYNWDRAPDKAGFEDNSEINFLILNEYICCNSLTRRGSQHIFSDNVTYVINIESFLYN